MPDAPTTITSAPSLDGLVDALDRVIGVGAVAAGEVVIALDGVDLIRIDLRLLIEGVHSGRTPSGGSDSKAE